MREIAAAQGVAGGITQSLAASSACAEVPTLQNVRVPEKGLRRDRVR
jgi:hypothetical protein